MTVKDQIIINGARLNNLKIYLSASQKTNWLLLQVCQDPESQHLHMTPYMLKHKEDILKVYHHMLDSF